MRLTQSINIFFQDLVFGLTCSNLTTITVVTMSNVTHATSFGMTAPN